MTGNVEFQRAAERDIEDLDASANTENRQTARERVGNHVKLPAVPPRIHIIVD